VNPAPNVAIVPTGVANLASVAAGLRRCGVEPVVTDEAGAIADAPAVVVPGVGAFGAGLETLRGHGIDGVVKVRIREGRPTLAVCLGMHLLCAASEESPGVVGLGLIDATVERFPSSVEVPQFGWNRVIPTDDCRMITPGYACFANSYRLTQPPEGWTVATADHAGPFIAAMERGDVLACQFHPELSGPWGVALLRRWLASAGLIESQPQPEEVRSC